MGYGRSLAFLVFLIRPFANFTLTPFLRSRETMPPLVISTGKFKAAVEMAKIMEKTEGK